MDGVLVPARFIWKTAGPAIFVAVTGLVLLGLVYDRQAREAWRQQSRAEVAEQLNLLTSGLQGRIDADMQLLRSFVAVVSVDPEIDAAGFERIGAELVNGREEVRLVTAVPDGRPSMAFPDDDGSAIGSGLPHRTPDPQLLETGEHWMSVMGPASSGSDDDLFLARAAVMAGAGRSLWGVVSLVIDAAAFFRAAGLDDPDLPLDVAIRTVESTGSLIYGDASVSESQPVLAELRLPGAAWQLAAIPEVGWQGPPNLWRDRLILAAFGLLLAGILVAAALGIMSRQRQLASTREREAELSRLSWRLDFALASSEVGVWDADLGTDELHWDERARRLFGREGDERQYFGLEDWTSVLHPEDRERAVAEADAAALGDGRFSTRYRIVLPSGEVRHIRDIAGVHEASDGTRRLVGLVWDITEEVNRQEELEQRRIEAEAATDAKSQFLAFMSHEIRTPMSGVLGVLGLMLHDPLPTKQRERAQIAMSSAESLLELLNNILDFSKLEAEELRIAPESFEIRRLVAQVTDLMSPNAIRKGLGLGYVVSTAVPRHIFADPARLRQILINLLSNATKFTERGEIMVRVDYFGMPSDGTLSVEVEDTGIGIRPEHRERIFERFAQADDPLARRAGGTGLGLAISSQLAELMGGVLSVRSVVDMGTTFSIEVPTRSAHPPARDGEAGGEHGASRQ